MVELPQIPLIDAREGGPAQVARLADRQLRELFRLARRLVTPPLLALGDRVARHWLERNGNPYLPEIEAIAARLPGRGAYALNASYEWCCTSGVGEDPQGGIRLLRVLDWGQSGLGSNLVLARQRGSAGEYINITWPGFVGVLTAMAPGRFAVALNQPPMPSWGLSLPVNWALSRIPVWRSQALPPAHLLRRVCDTCANYAEAKVALAQTPLCIPALFTIAGTTLGERVASSSARLIPLPSARCRPPRPTTGSRWASAAGRAARTAANANAKWSRR